MTVVSLDMAYRSFLEVWQALTRLDTPPLSNRRHPDSRIAPDAGSPKCLDRAKEHHRDSASVIGLGSFAARHGTGDLENQPRMTDRDRVHVIAAAELIG